MILYIKDTRIVMSTPGDKIPNLDALKHLPFGIPDYDEVVTVDDYEAMTAASKFEVVNDKTEITLIDKETKKEKKLKKK